MRLSDKREYWFCFFTTKGFAGEQKLTPPAAEDFCRTVAQTSNQRAECFRGTSEKLEGGEAPFCIKFPTPEF